MTAASKYSLPLIDSVLRPSVDPKITKLHVTRLEMEKVEVVQQPQVDATMLMYMQRMGQPMPQPTVVKMLQPKATSTIISRVPEKKESSAERIRGGGGEGSEMPGNNAGDAETQPPSAPPAQEEKTAENPPAIAEAASAPTDAAAETQATSESQANPEEAASESVAADATPAPSAVLSQSLSSASETAFSLLAQSAR